VTATTAPNRPGLESSSSVRGSSPSDRPHRNTWVGWPLERILFALAGTMTGLSALLSAFVSPWFLLLTGFISLNLLAFSGVGICGASLILRRVFGVRSACDRIE
jgi:hypothetical protein